MFDLDSTFPIFDYDDRFIIENAIVHLLTADVIQYEEEPDSFVVGCWGVFTLEDFEDYEPLKFSEIQTLAQLHLHSNHAGYAVFCVRKREMLPVDDIADDIRKSFDYNRVIDFTRDYSPSDLFLAESSK